MKECEHKNGYPEHLFWQCTDCGWISPSGEHRGPNNGFFPSLEAVREYDKFKTYPGMGEVKPMTPNEKVNSASRAAAKSGD